MYCVITTRSPTRLLVTRRQCNVLSWYNCDHYGRERAIYGLNVDHFNTISRLIAVLQTTHFRFVCVRALVDTNAWAISLFLFFL